MSFNLKLWAFFASNIIVSLGLPIEHSDADGEQDLLSQSNIKLHQMANILMAPHFDESHKLETTFSHLKAGEGFAKSSHELSGFHGVGVHNSHLLEVSKDVAIGAALMPAKVSADSAAAGSIITAGAGIAGTAVGSAIATPIIVKAVALPGIAAGKTAALMSVPSLLAHKLIAIPEGFVHNLKAFDLKGLDLKAFGHALPDLSELVVVDNTEEVINEEDFDVDKGVEHLAVTAGLLKAGLKTKVIAMKAGAIGLAKKPLIVAKKIAVIAGRLILKPIGIIAGLHLKAIGTGLAIGGKLVKVTGAKIAKVGTVVKYAGLGHIGIGASFIGWGLDKSTIDTHFKESHRKFETNIETNTETKY